MRRATSLVLLVAALCSLCVLAPNLAARPEGAAPPASAGMSSAGAASAPVAPTSVGDVKSFWAMVQLGGGIGYLIIAVLGIGLFLALVQLFELWSDGRGTKRLLAIEFAGVPLDDIPARLQPGANSWLGRLLLAVVHLYKVSGTAQSVQQEISNFVQYVQDRFDSFRGRMAFLSDSAGALGLLGTVWGMFLTFFGGNLSDSEKILNGMGIALVTTLLGLVVSLVLNFSATELFTMFNRRLEVMAEKSDELRLRLLELERDRLRTQAFAPAGPGMPWSIAEPELVPRETLRPQPSPQASRPARQPALPHLEVRSNLPETLSVGSAVAKALRVRVVAEDGRALAGEKVVFAIVRGDATLGEWGREHTELSSAKGEMICDFVTGSKPSVCELLVSLATDTTRSWQTTIKVVADKPSRVRITGGNDQSAAAGAMLPQPLRVAVTDRFGNPVAGVGVRFRVTLGEGMLEGGSETCTKATGSEGVAEVRYTLGPAPGFHRVVAEVEGLETAALEFRALARE